MKTTHLLAAAAASALIGGAAYAQNAETLEPSAVPDQAPPSAAATPTDAPPAAADTAPAPSDTAVNPPAADAAANVSTDASAVSSPGQTGQTINVTTLTNGPVPDTPENRAKYMPLSRAGNRTAAAGN